MMYKIELKISARKYLKKIDSNLRKKILRKIEDLKENPLLGQVLKYDLKNLRKLYFQNKKIRIIYRVENKALIIEIISIGKRNKSEIYKQVVKKISEKKYENRISRRWTK